MTKVLIALTVLGLCVAANAGRAGNRQARQAARIQQGASNGQLTAKESARLERQQGRIEQAQAKASSDGNVSNAEKAKLEKMQDRASKEIYAAKHNNRTPASTNSASSDR